MKLLLFGKHGQLGWELHRTLACLGEVIAFDYPDIDLTQAGQAGHAIAHHKPDVVVNAAAYTTVDQAEQEIEKAYAINQDAPAEMAQAARKIGSAFIHYSTDYVFDGVKKEPYREDDQINPLNTYGKSKLAGELAIQEAGDKYWIFRTAWVYSLRGETFVNKTLDWARKNTSLRIVDDQVSSPTWARMLAEATAHALVKVTNPDGLEFEKSTGLYHLAGRGSASRFEWAREILACVPADYGLLAREIFPAKSADFPTPAQRPPFSALDCTKFERTFGFLLPDWKKALSLALEDLH